MGRPAPDSTVEEGRGELIMKLSKEEVVNIAIEILKEKEFKLGKDRGMRLADLLAEIKKRISKIYPDESIKESAIYGILRDEVKRESGNIFSGGPHKGYYYIEGEGGGKEKIRESSLYPIVEMWLNEKKQYGVVSKVYNRTKNKKWGNPDIVGVNLYDDFGVKHIEIATVEVKPDLKDWRQYIFEAVSHKRFADKAYFMFWLTESEAMKELEEMYMYADKYNIGLCQITIGKKDIDGWEKKSEGEKIEIIDSCIIELFPAPIDDAGMREKLNFLKNLGVRSKISFDAQS